MQVIQERPRSKVWAMTFDKAVEGAVKRDRLVVVVALGFVVALSWIYVLAGAGMNLPAFETTRTSSGEDSMGMMIPAVWSFGETRGYRGEPSQFVQGLWPAGKRAHRARMSESGHEPSFAACQRSV